jgi:hypothetical protein
VRSIREDQKSFKPGVTPNRHATEKNFPRHVRRDEAGTDVAIFFLFISDAMKKARPFYSRAQYYKTFRFSNLRQMSRFCNKLVSFLRSVTNTLAWTNMLGLNKHASLLRNP